MINKTKQNKTNKLPAFICTGGVTCAVGPSVNTFRARSNCRDIERERERERVVCMNDVNIVDGLHLFLIMSGVVMMIL